LQVYDDLALQDATALFRFLARRGYVTPAADSPLLIEHPALLRPPSPLTGVDMIKAQKTGVVVSTVTCFIMTAALLSVEILHGATFDNTIYNTGYLHLVASFFTVFLFFSMTYSNTSLSISLMMCDVAMAMAVLCCAGQAWTARPGDEVVAGQVLGEIVDMVDMDAARVPVVTRTSGLFFGTVNHKLVKPGQIIAKVAGNEPLSWRTGNLLTL
jgi:hypothetical protein